MLPIRDHNPSGRTPFVTYSLIAINVIIFLAFNLSLGEGNALNQFFYAWGMVPAHISQGQDYYTLITSQFLHGGIMHIGDNMLFLWIFGDNMEDKMGHIPFLVDTGVRVRFVGVVPRTWDIEYKRNLGGVVADRASMCLVIESIGLGLGLGLGF